MSTRPSASAEDLARLSELLSTPRGHKILRYMARVGLLASETEAAVPAAAGSAAAARAADAGEAPLTIGVWQAQQVDGARVFVRSEALRPEWREWADVEQIPAKASKKRVVLIGESVAHGYFYAPYFTPAAALREALSGATDDGVEIIDLSRLNMSLLQLAQLHQQALEALAPDVIVLFAGNNWHPLTLLSHLAREDYARLLRQDGLGRLVAARKAELRGAVRSTLAGMAAAARAAAKPVVFVLPEFSYGDWHDAWYTPWLAGASQTDHAEARRRAEQALATDDLDTAESLANDMIAWEGDVVGYGRALLGECRRRQDRAEEARAHFEQAWDGFFLNPSMSMPRCLPVSRDAVHEVFAGEGLHVVDLRVTFADHLGGALPGHDLFVDYCHLSAEGIRVAMAATGERLLAILTQARVEWRQLLERISTPSDEVEAESLVARAFQNSGMGQPQALLEACLKRALRSKPRLGQILLTICARRAPIWVDETFGELMDGGEILSRLAIAAYVGDSYIALAQRFDKPLVSALEGLGEEPRETFETLLTAELGIGTEPVDLLHPRYYKASLQQRGVFWAESGPAAHAFQALMSAAGYYRAYSRTSTFSLVAAAAIHLDLTWRLPKGGSGHVTIDVNGQQLSRIFLSGGWEKSSLVVPAEYLTVAIQTVEIHWPAPSGEGEAELERAGEQMELGRVPDLYPVFGEIHAFRATRAVPVS